MLMLVAPQEFVGIFIVRVFRLDGYPSLVSWIGEIISRLSCAMDVCSIVMDGCSILVGDIGSRQAINVNMPSLISSGYSLCKYHNFEV